MKLTDLTYLTLENFKNRKSRIILTVFGVAVAIAVVLSLVSFGYGLQKSLIENITTADSLLALDITPSDSDAIKFDDSMVGDISKIQHVDKVSAQAKFKGQASYNGTISEASINVVQPDFFSLNAKQPLSGRFFTDKDTKKVVVSSVVADLFNLDKKSILGKKMSYILTYSEKDATSTKEVTFGNDFEIVGVVEGSGNTADIYMDRKDFTFAPINTYQFAKVKVTNSTFLNDVRTQIINKGFVVSSLSDIVDQANKIFQIVQITLGVFGTFALLVAAIGLVNTMTVSLLERTNEIGIMRAIGASPTDIQAIFLVESILIGLLGGVSGVLIGISISEVLNWLFNLLANYLGGAPVRLFLYPFWFIFFIIILSTIVGLMGGLWPSRRAAKMNPLEALRYK